MRAISAVTNLTERVYIVVTFGKPTVGAFGKNEIFSTGQKIIMLFRIVFLPEIGNTMRGYFRGF